MKSRLDEIDLKLLRVFTTIAEAGGYSAAQGFLNRTLPTISSQMSELERKLGFQLCKRGRAGFALTEKGRLVYEEARRLYLGFDGFRIAAGAIGGKLVGSLNIGLVEAVALSEALPMHDVISRFSRNASNATVNLSVAPRVELERAVFENRLHAAIGPFVRGHIGFSFSPLFREDRDVYCGRGHSLFHMPFNKIDKQAISQCVVSARAYSDTDDCDRIGGRRTGPKVFALEVQLTYLLSGAFVGYLPVQYAAPWVKKKKLRAIGSERMRQSSLVYLISKREARPNPLLSHFLNAIDDIRNAASGSK